MQKNLDSTTLLTEKYRLLLPHLNEACRRLYLAAEAIGLGRGGISKVARLAAVSRVTLTAGIKELRSSEATTRTLNQVRRAGGGRKKAVDVEKGLVTALKRLVEPHTVGDPTNALLWTSKSTRHLADELSKQGFSVSYNVVNRILRAEGFSLQANKKTNEGESHLDRDAQFEHINATSVAFISRNEPVISVDCKKKELIGEFKNAGSEWAPKGGGRPVNVYDFVDKELGKAVPYGVYDLERNEGWVSVGISADTAKFAVSSIRNWWFEMGVKLYGESKRMYINADGGGSNSSRSRLWKTELQVLANELNKEIQVSHFPPGTSKWNKIEHRMFSFITMNWRATPLVSLQVIINLIASTTTRQGLKINAKVDTELYKKGIKISDRELKKVNVEKNDFHGEWNYIIRPNV